MKNENKKLSMAQYMVYMSAVIVMVCSLTFLLSACTEEMMDGPQKPYTGAKMIVNFKFAGLSNPDNEIVTRSGAGSSNLSKGGAQLSPFEGDGEGVSVMPVADDLYMYTSIEADHDVNTRSGIINLDKDTKLTIVAYRDGTIYHTHVKYTIDHNGELVGDAFKVGPDIYNFVAYSYNSKTDFPPDPGIVTLSNINPDIDLLWGESGLRQITESFSDDIPITLVHKFSEVRVMITTEDMSAHNITGIDNILIVPNRLANLSIKDGIMTEGNEIMQNFPLSPTSGLSTNTVTTERRKTYTNKAGQTNIWIGSLTLNGSQTFINQTAIFDKPLQGGVSYTLKISFKRSATPTIVDSTPMFSTLMYVGAFWKANQTGERLIRIRRPTTGTVADGAWTARVIVGNEWIVLDKKMTTDPNVGWLVGANESLVKNGNDAGFDSSHPVNSILTAVSGNWSETEKDIYFRIGLKSTLPNPNGPPRYGMILLTYNNNTKLHRIWIRQGEAADYVFSNNDPISVSGVSSRTLARRFSPYNLTADKLNAVVDKRGTGSNGNPGKPTAYPSQAGAFFLWGNSSASAARWGYNPHPQASINWYGGYSQSYWSAISQDHETCPPGYRRPNDGLIHAAETGQTNIGSHIARSEMRQSLLLQPKTGFNEANDHQNATWGYYADGFFDRRAMTEVDQYEHFPKRPATVAYNTDQTAHVGQLFFNPIESSNHYAASVFFPAVGFRNPSSGALQNYGHYGWYWTSSAYQTDWGILFRVRARYDTPLYPDVWRVELWRGAKTHGAAIRCVVDE